MILSLWFPRWPVQRVAVTGRLNVYDRGQRDSVSGQRDETGRGEDREREARDRPLALYALDRGTLRVRCCCRQAAALGIGAGMPLAEARAVAGSDLLAEEHDDDGDGHALAELAVLCRQFSPVCGVDAGKAGLTLDVSGCGHLFGGDRALAAAAVRELRGRGYDVRGGLGLTVGVAWAAARSRVGPDGVCEVPAADARAWMDRRPVAALRLSEGAVSGLADFDLRTVGQVRRLPREQLPSRFGGELLRRLDQADGVVPEAVEPVLPAEPPSRSWRTDDPLRKSELVAIVLDRLIDELLTPLPAGVGVLKLSVRIGAARGEVCVDVATAKPTRSPDRLKGLLSLRLERTRLPRDVDRVSLEASSLDLLCRVQTDLFGNPLAGEADGRFADLVERLTGRLGEERVSYAELTPEPLPKRSVRLVPAVKGRPAIKPGSEAAAPALFTRPMRLLARPRPTRVWAVDRRPHQVEYRGQTHLVGNVWGPQRIETGWWEEGGEQRRDYYRVELVGGECLWLYRTPGCADWLLHGEF